ncbi:MAG: hypothetical protein V4773_28925 [Verrucomicrobiota bacterium]
MHPKNLLCVLAAFLSTALFAAAPTGPQQDPSPKATDGVRILEILPSKLVAGEEQEVFVRVRYQLESLEQGHLSLTFNTHESARYRAYAKEIVNKGSGELVLTARVVPRDWGDVVFFQASVSLVEIMTPPPPPKPGDPKTTRISRQALAFDHAPIPLIPKKS